MTLPPKSPRILIARLSAHGDVVTTLPVLATLRDRCPEAHIGWLIDESAAGLLNGIHELDTVHVYPGKTIKKALKTPQKWPFLVQKMQDLAQELAAVHYDASLDVQGLFKSALLPALAKIPRRFGFARTREFADCFYTDKLPPINLHDPSRHVVDCYVEAAHRMLNALGIPKVQEGTLSVRFPLPDNPKITLSEAIQADLKALKSHGLHTGQSMIMLAPATRWQSKQWPLDHWQTLLKNLLDRGHPVAIVGGPGDRDLTQAIQANILSKVHPGLLMDWTGQTHWPELWQILPHADVFIGPDSAPLHMAAALAHQTGRPRIIGLYGPTAAGRTGPYPDLKKSHNVLSTSLACQPCFKKRCRFTPDTPEFMRCIEDLSPELVLTLL